MGLGYIRNDDRGIKGMKKVIAALMTAVMVLGITSCKKDLKTKTNIENEISKLQTVDGNIWINFDKEYENMVNVLLYQAQETDLRGSLIVATDDEVIFASGTGLLDNDGNEVSLYTTYEIGSITKSFTAVSIMKLVQEGKVSLDDTLEKYFPEYSDCAYYDRTSKVTISNMLHMRSGIPDYVNEPTLFFDAETIMNALGYDAEFMSEESIVHQLYNSVDDDTIMRSVFSCRPNNEPDTEFQYSNTNYFILAVILERVTGRSYEEYLTEEIFEPCGMKDTTSMSFGDVTASIKDDAWYTEPCQTKGCGDIHSTVVDLLRYDRALFGGYLLNDKTMEEFFYQIDGYACGFFKEKEDLINHGGSTHGFHTENYVIERNGKHLYIIMFANQKENTAFMIYKYLNPLFESED